MTVLSAQTIRRRVAASRALRQTGPVKAISTFRLAIEPYEPESKKAFGMSYGVTAAGYDIRIGSLGQLFDFEGAVIRLNPGDFMLVASLEHVTVPHDLQVIVHDKSTLARQGLALQNTVLEPGWAGHITLELSNHGDDPIDIRHGMPIAQLIFHKLDEPTDTPYEGKYQDQIATPVEAILESGED